MTSSDSNHIVKKLKEWSHIEQMTMIEQSNYKYILNIDGYVTAWRLSCELSYNSCILLLYSKYYSWFHDKLVHMKNVYKIDVESDELKLKDELSKALHIFANNDNIGKKIARGARKLYDEIMNVAYIKKYMTSLLLQKEFDILIPFEK